MKLVKIIIILTITFFIFGCAHKIIEKPQLTNYKSWVFTDVNGNKVILTFQKNNFEFLYKNSNDEILEASMKGQYEYNSGDDIIEFYVSHYYYYYWIPYKIEIIKSIKITYNTITIDNFEFIGIN